MWYDIAVLGVLVYFMARGASRGLIWQCATIAGIVLCFMFAETFSGVVGPHITIAAPYNEWVTMFAAYLFFSFLSFGAARMLTKSIEQAGLKEYNAHLGAILGLAKGAVLCLVLTFFLATLQPTHDLIRNSKSGYYAALTMQKIHPIMPEKLHDALNKYIHSLDNIPGLPPVEHDHTINPDVGLVDAIRDAANAVDQKLGNPFADQPTAPPPSRQPYDPWSTTPSNPASQPGAISSIPAGARWPSQPGYQAPASPQANPPYNSPPQPSSSADFWAEVRGALGTQARQTLAETLNNMDPATRETLQKQILESLHNTKSEDLPNFEKQLLRTGAQALPNLLSRWGGSTPTAPAAPPAPVVGDRERLLSDVSQLRSGFPQIQTRLQAELRGLMAGLPDQVAVAVLNDWKADLSNNAAGDPDSDTDVNTPVEIRILRQMQRYGIKVQSLDPVLRERLSSGAAGLQLR